MKIDSTNSIVYSYEDNKEYISKAKGNVKTKKNKPLVGDKVKFEIIDNEQGYITEIIKRKNELYRPKMANVDQVFLVSALKEPNIGTYIIDKYLMFLDYLDIKPVLVFTKVDLLNDDDIETKKLINDYQKIGYKVLLMNNKKPDIKILDEMRQLMIDNISIFVGQTGAGKTTTLNNFLNIEEHQKTQEISKALNRGKHTTTNVSLYLIENKIMIADSPGFSSFEVKIDDYKDLNWSLKVFKEYMGMCKFNNCIHMGEIGCEIRKKVNEGVIPEFIYEDYKKVILELKEGKR